MLDAVFKFSDIPPHTICLPSRPQSLAKIRILLDRMESGTRSRWTTRPTGITIPRSELGVLDTLAHLNSVVVAIRRIGAGQHDTADLHRWNLKVLTAELNRVAARGDHRHPETAFAMRRGDDCYWPVVLAL